MLDRDKAMELLLSLQPEAHLVQHAVAAEAVMRGLARHCGEDETLWGLTGLLHDVDFPQTRETPERHGLAAMDILGDKLPPEALAAIRAHNADYTGCTPTTPLDYALRCGETVTGLIVTAALVRPTGMEGMQPSSLKKKMKDKAFAASVSRDHIRECANIGLELGDFLQIAIDAITPVASAAGCVRSA